eukprot:TRINITY_DN84739_c0_g1_i1.p1 TRINITY_DN84739_c0_g1~~TRINITY_DN84739_c0_g1_i1.p1  ORF type:complete len:370 (-),score=64.53 TRINITY_DN84739_c0_g1_i1:191-1195(-)
MKAVCISGIGGTEVLVEKEFPKPSATQPFDLLVEVKAVSMNPVDFKVRSVSAFGGAADKILGYDASGVVVEVGPKCTRFKPGDEVFYAGDITRQGSNAAFQLIDERIVGKKPSSLSFTDAAAFPLVAITAYEALFERMCIPEGPPSDNKTILIVAGAGGLGAMTIQLAKKLCNMRVVATASRDSSIAFCKKMGADFTINHRNNYKEELKKIGIDQVDYIMNCIDLDKNFDQCCDVLAPFGKICSPTTGAEKLDVSKLFFPKAASLSFVCMFTRSMLGVEPEVQHALLNRVSRLIDSGLLQPLATEKLAWSRDNLAEAHKKSESGGMIGKLVLTM